MEELFDFETDGGKPAQASESDKGWNPRFIGTPLTATEPKSGTVVQYGFGVTGKDSAVLTMLYLWNGKYRTVPRLFTLILCQNRQAVKANHDAACRDPAFVAQVTAATERRAAQSAEKAASGGKRGNGRDGGVAALLERQAATAAAERQAAAVDAAFRDYRSLILTNPGAWSKVRAAAAADLPASKVALLDAMMPDDTPKGGKR